MTKSLAAKPQVGMIGLGVMGSNLVRNIERNGFPCAVYNRDPEILTSFMEKFGSGNFVACPSLAELVSSMERPRKIFMLIMAGSPVDQVLESLLPLLDEGDIVIDGGNSYFKDTARREKLCKERKIHFLGIGVSGGEEGALNGPSLMPGGPKDAWALVNPLLEKIAARAEGNPCTGYVGPDGSGHFVKMVHNGIEYGDMQLIAEAYDLLRRVVGLQPPALAEVFQKWNEGPLSSFLIEITADIFRKREGSGFLVDYILDKAGQKGTGMWTAQVSLDLGVAIPTLAAAVDARFLSAIKEERVTAARQFDEPLSAESIGDEAQFVQQVHDALYCSKVLAYAQGMALLARASEEYHWDLKLDQIAAMWKGGCIIRAKFLETIRAAFHDNKQLSNLLLHPMVKQEIARTLPALREVVALSAARAVPVLAFSSALAYFDSYCSAEMPQNLTQAQRDYFGAHTYQRKDKPGTFHTEWSA